MSTNTDIRTFAPRLVDRMSAGGLQALLDLLDEEFFTPEEIEEINRLRQSEEWIDWRG